MDAHDTTASHPGQQADDRGAPAPRLLASTRLLLWADRLRWPVLVFVLLGYLAGFNGQWRMSNDSCNHLVIAANIAEGNGYTHPDGMQRHLAPGLSYSIAATFRVFGTESLFPALALMWVASLTVLALTYWLFSLVGGRGVAVLMTFLLAVNVQFYEFGFRLLTEMPFLIGAMLLLVGYERIHRRIGLVAASLALIGAGFLVMAAFRSVALVFAAALLVTLAIELIRRRRFVALAGACVLLLAVVAAVRWADPSLDHPFQLGSDEQFFKTRLVENLSWTLAEIRTNANRLLTDALAEVLFGVDFGFMAAPLAIAALVCTLTLIRIRLLWFVLIVTFICQWLLVIVTERYCLPILPLLIFAWWRGALWLEPRLPRRWAVPVLTLMLALLVIPNAIRVGDLFIEQRTRPFLASYKDGKYENPSRLAAWIRQNTEPDAMVFAPRQYSPIILYLSRRHAVSSVTRDLRRATFVYAALPADAPAPEALEQRRWTLDEPLVTIAGDDSDRAWTLYPVNRPGRRPPR
jgi:4-amino-4-deoxy-L-arabinose transferase-like glycosyltransferase